MNKTFKHTSILFLLSICLLCFWVSCTPAEDVFPKELKSRVLGTWSVERMLVTRWNNTLMRWDTLPVSAVVTPSVLSRATLTFRVDGTYAAIDPTIDRSVNPRANRGQVFAVSPRFDFAAGWSINTPLGGLWEFVDNYSTLHLDKGNPEGNGFPPEKWVMEELTDTRLRLYKNAPATSLSPLPLRIWYTFNKRN
jgi:hypothetical protein